MRTQNNRIQVAGVVGKVDALARVRLAIDPAHGEPAEQFGKRDNEVTGERHETSLPAT